MHSQNYSSLTKFVLDILNQRIGMCSTYCPISTSYGLYDPYHNQNNYLLLSIH